LHSLVYFFVYTVRVKGWTFGFGSLIDAVGRMLSGIKSIFVRKNKTDEKPVGAGNV